MDGEFKVPRPIRSSENNLQSKKENIFNHAVTASFECPEWAGIPEVGNGMESYCLDVVKDGSVIQVIELNKKPYYIIGRTPTCDIVLNNESISRQHAAIVFKSNGDVFLYDMGSTHGTFLNKNEKLEQHCYKQLQSGYCMQFGSSERKYFLNGGLIAPVTVVNTQIFDKFLNNFKPIQNSENPKSSDEHFEKVLSNQRFKQQVESSESDDSSSLGEIDSSDDEKQRNQADLDMVKNLLGREYVEGGVSEDNYFDQTERTRDTLILPSINSAETFETVLFKKSTLSKFIELLKEEIETLTHMIDDNNENSKNQVDLDSLDAYMGSILCNEMELQFLKQKKNLQKLLETEAVKIDGALKILTPKSNTHHIPAFVNRDLQAFFRDYTHVLQREYEKTGSISQISRDKRALSPDSPKNLQIENDLTKKIKFDMDTPVTTQVLSPEFHIPQQSIQSTLERTDNTAHTSDNDDEDYEPWSAPEGQTGTGRTELNDKYGY